MNEIEYYLKGKVIDFELNVDLIRDHAYLTQNLFHNKKITNDEQFLVLIKYLKFFDVKNPFLGGVITNLIYRVAENYSERSFVVPILIELKKKYDQVVDLSHPINTRWLLSSTNTLSTFLLATSDVSNAKLLIEKGLKRYSLGSHTPLVNQNLAMIYLQYAMIKFCEKKFNLSSSLFERCLYHCSNSLNEIYSVRNNYLGSMFSDCDNLIEISKNATLGISVRKSRTVGSRSDVNAVNRAYFSKVVTNRFYKKFILENTWHKEIDNEINAVISGK